MADLQSILKLEVPVVVRLGERTMTLADVVALAPGVILELPKHADEELDLLVNNKAIGCGNAVKVGENFGIRVSFIGDLKDRIEAMGGATVAKKAEAQSDEDALAEAMLAGQG
ncbi:MAG: flagellar motor switch protein FliN [Phycisphaerales bacterium]|nr:MAG: flagellar motor switch protein FliN [Phycisphaerales bacterium]